jgi:hypothetical protein
MVFLKHIKHKLQSADEIRTILGHVRDTASEVAGVSLRDFFILQDREEFILVMDCPDEGTYHHWRSLCPPPPGARDWVEAAYLPETFGKVSGVEE